MSFLSLLFAFLIEQVRPFIYNTWVQDQVAKFAQWARLHLDAGLEKQAWAAWCAVALLPTLLVAAIYWLMIEWGSWFMGLLWSVAVLYICLGFRQFSHHFTEIRDALESGKEDVALGLLARWQHLDVNDLKPATLIRNLIEHSVIQAHRHVFGVLYWYCILSVMGFGPAGAVLYRLCEILVYVWTKQKNVIEGEEILSSEPLLKLTRQIWFYMDWLPARLTAISFAIVGNFEEAIDSWRFHLNRFGQTNDAVILASTAGALNIELGVTPLKGQSLQDTGEPELRESQSGQAPQLAHLKTVVGLLWRAVVMWMLILALFSLSRIFSSVS
jgi:adenosylcobinamide-phosphate synthase